MIFNARMDEREMAVVQKTSKKWETITKKVRAWVLEQDDSEEERKYFWGFKWSQNTLINIQRDVGGDCTRISTAYGLTGDDLAYYQKIGGHDWRVVMRMGNAQMGRAEIGFLAGSAPGFVLIDSLYDDAFTKDELYRRVRTIALTELFLVASLKYGKTKARMRDAEPTDFIPFDFDDTDDLQTDRFRPEFTGGRIGSHKFMTKRAFIGSIILSEMAAMESDYGPVLDTKLVIHHIIEKYNFPVTLLTESINHLKKIGMLFEDENGRIRGTAA